MDFDFFITVFVVVALMFIIYTVIKGNSLRDTWDEITELFTGG